VILALVGSFIAGMITGIIASIVCLLWIFRDMHIMTR
jgi:sorbitol-specific phosphotransferase system component IIC